MKKRPLRGDVSNLTIPIVRYPNILSWTVGQANVKAYFYYDVAAQVISKNIRLSFNFRVYLFLMM